MQSPSCSAAKVTSPPSVGVSDEEALPELALLLLLPPQAAAKSTNVNRRQRSEMPRRCRLTKTNLLVD
jgi:hypothetical protein